MSRPSPALPLGSPATKQGQGRSVGTQTGSRAPNLYCRRSCSDRSLPRHAPSMAPWHPGTMAPWHPGALTSLAPGALVAPEHRGAPEHHSTTAVHQAGRASTRDRLEESCRRRPASTAAHTTLHPSILPSNHPSIHPKPTAGCPHQTQPLVTKPSPGQLTLDLKPCLSVAVSHLSGEGRDTAVSARWRNGEAEYGAHLLC